MFSLKLLIMQYECNFKQQFLNFHILPSLFSPISTFNQYSGLMFLLIYLNDFQYSEYVSSDCKIKEGIALLGEMLI